MATPSTLSNNTRCLVEKAFESIQNDFKSELQKSNGLLRGEIEKVVNDTHKMTKGIESMEEFIEHMHRQNPLTKKKVDELEERLKIREDEIEQLKKKLSKYEEAQTEHDEKLVNLVNSTGQETEQEVEISQPRTSGGKSANYEFKGNVEGDKVIIGAETAVISEGGDMKFPVTSLQSNDPNSMHNKDGEMPMGNGGGGSSEPVKVDFDGSIIGVGKANISSTTNKVYISGSKEENIEEHDDEEKITYRQADREEFSRFLEREMNKADEDNEIIKLSPDEDFQEREIIIHYSDLIKRREGSVEHFKHLCDLLKPLSPRQLRSLAPELGHIVKIDLTGIRFDYESLSAFFRCFKSKTFCWLLLGYTNILASDMRMLGSSLSGCRIEYLDLGNCSFEYMSFLELASVILHVEFLILHEITSASIIPENSQGPLKPFSADEARHLANSIAKRDRPISTSLTSCNLYSVDIATAFSTCMKIVTSLSLQYSLLHEQSVDALLGPVQKIKNLDFSGAQLRSSGVKGVSAHIGKTNALILSNVMMDKEGVQPLLDALESLEKKQLDVLDISSNPIGADNVSKLLKLSGKVRVMVFSKDQIQSYEKHFSDIVNDEALLSEVVEGKAVRLEQEAAPAGYFSFWTTCAKPIENIQKQLLMQATTLSPVNLQARVLRNYMCMQCGTHIAFENDKIPSPCHNLLNNRNLFGAIEGAYFVTVSHAVSCIPTPGKPKKHSCGNPSCKLAKYKMRSCKCTECQLTLGGFYSAKTGEIFWCLYQKDPNGPLVGIMGQSCKQM